MNNNHLVPAYLLPYVLTGSVAVAGTSLLGLRALAGASSRARWTLSEVLAAWFFAALATSWLGFYQGSPSRAPTIQYGLLIPILIGILLFWRWPALQRIVAAVPQRWIVTIQLYRVLGAIFLILYAAGRIRACLLYPPVSATFWPACWPRWLAWLMPADGAGRRPCCEPGICLAWLTWRSPSLPAF